MVPPISCRWTSTDRASPWVVKVEDDGGLRYELRTMLGWEISGGFPTEQPRGPGMIRLGTARCFSDGKGSGVADSCYW